MEPGWSWAKAEGIGNRCLKTKQGLEELWRKVRRRLRREVDANALIRHCFAP